MKRTTSAVLLVMLFTVPALAVWEPVPDPYFLEGLEFFVSGDDQLYAAASVQSKVFGSHDLGDTWTEVAGGIPEEYSPIWSLVITGDWMIMSRLAAETFNYRSQRIDGEWERWQELPVQEGRVADLTAVGDRIFGLFNYDELRYSDDFGWSWTPISIDGDPAIGRIFAAEGRLFACEQETAGGTIYRSDDGGETWTDVGSGFASSYVCSQIYWQDRLLACVYHGGGDSNFWSSTDFGDSWDLVTTLPTPRNINALAIGDDGRLAIGASGTYQGQTIWLSEDLVNWENYDEDLPQSSRSFGDLVAHDGWFFKTGGTATRYRAPQPGLTGAEDGPIASPEIKLAAWPNPFNPRTTLRFELAVAGVVELAIFDLAGRQVDTVCRGELSAGPHAFAWEARNEAGSVLPSGIYVARLKTVAGWSAEKLVLLQ